MGLSFHSTLALAVGQPARRTDTTRRTRSQTDRRALAWRRPVAQTDAPSSRMQNVLAFSHAHFSGRSEPAGRPVGRPGQAEPDRAGPGRTGAVQCRAARMASSSFDASILFICTGCSLAQRRRRLQRQGRARSIAGAAKATCTDQSGPGKEAQSQSAEPVHWARTLATCNLQRPVRVGAPPAICAGAAALRPAPWARAQKTDSAFGLAAGWPPPIGGAATTAQQQH